MKTIKLLHGVLHMPSPTWESTITDIAAISVMTGDR